MATPIEIRARIADLEVLVSQLTQQLAFSAPTDNNTIQRIRVELARANAELTQLRTELLNLASDEQVKSLPTASSGQIIVEEGTATSNPRPPLSVLTPDGRINPQNVERGTDALVRSQEETQSTPPFGNGSVLPYATPGNQDGVQTPFVQNPFVSTQAGAASARDDNTRPNSNATAQLLNANFNQRITPQPNVLDQYASYTYSLTWYLLTPDQYNEMTRSQKKNCASWQLLMQSGGAPTKAAGITDDTTATTVGRNQFFDKDYYLDNLEIESRIPLKGTGSPDGRVSIKFTVTEPNGISLIDNLYKAVDNLYKQTNVTKKGSYPDAHYCMVIRFYGYDEAGNLVNVGRRGSNGKTNLTDPRAVVEKFFPFRIIDIKFKIPKDRIVEYQIEGKPIPHFYNKSQDRGTILYAVELTGETVQQVLQGRPVSTVAVNSPGERRDSPQPNTSAPSNPSAIDPNQTGSAQVDEQGNFTGASDSPFQVGA